MKHQPPDPAIGDIWIKHAYKTVGYPAGRVTITDVVEIPNKGTIVKYHYIAGTQMGKLLSRDLVSFQRIYIHGSSASPQALPDPEAQLPFAVHTEAYRGEEEDPS